MSRLLTTCIAASTTILLGCQSYAPITPLRLGQPVITKVTLAEARFSTYREAVHIEWSPPPSDSIAVRSYTLLRKTTNDSLFDIFTRSQGIPDSITSFNDDLTLIGFPMDSDLLVMYKIVPVDTLGRAGDTSAACSLYIAPQPVLTSIDTTSWCFNWTSHGIQGSVSSYIKVWNAAGTISWTSMESEGFGNENVQLPFSACLPDSLKPENVDTWYFAVFIDANGSLHQSIKVGSFNVP